MKRFIALFAVTVIAAIGAGSASAGHKSNSGLKLLTPNTCSFIENAEATDGSWCPALTSQTGVAGGTVTFLVKAYDKKVDQGNDYDAVVSFVPDAGLTLVYDGDNEGATQNGNSVSYTDYQYGSKYSNGVDAGMGDNYTFQLADDLAPGTYQIKVCVLVWNDGPKVVNETLTITIPEPAPAVTPQIDREGSCTVVGNQFENVDADQLSQGSYVATDGSTVAIVPADFVEGLGLTCDVPKGATPAGYDVADNFGGVEGVVDTAAPQFNFYPYYTQA